MMEFRAGSRDEELCFREEIRRILRCGKLAGSIHMECVAENAGCRVSALPSSTSPNKLNASPAHPVFNVEKRISGSHGAWEPTSSTKRLIEKGHCYLSRLVRSAD